MKKVAFIAATGLIAVLGGHAIAQQQTTSDFNTADANKDNVVSMAEAMGVYPTLTQPLFDQADENKDGVLSETEFGALKGLTAGLDENLPSTSSSASDGSSSSTSSSSSSSSSDLSSSG